MIGEDQYHVIPAFGCTSREVARRFALLMFGYDLIGDSELTEPSRCSSCKYFHGANDLVCAVHPTYEGDREQCIDYEPAITQTNPGQ
jgi:hypothetical protein